MEFESITFYHCKKRCHAMIVKQLIGKEKYIGHLDGYNIYEMDEETKGILFDQWGFVAIKEEGK